MVSDLFSLLFAHIKQDIRLELVENLTIVESFIQHLKQSRRVNNKTAACYVRCFISAAKFLRANESQQL